MVYPTVCEIVIDDGFGKVEYDLDVEDDVDLDIEIHLDDFHFEEEVDDDEFREFLQRFYHAWSLSDDGDSSLLVAILEEEIDMVQDMIDFDVITENDYNRLIDTADEFMLNCELAIAKNPSATYEDFKNRLTFALRMGELTDDLFLTYVVKYDWMNIARHVNSGEMTFGEYEEFVARADSYNQTNFVGQIVSYTYISDAESESEDGEPIYDIEWYVNGVDMPENSDDLEELNSDENLVEEILRAIPTRFYVGGDESDED